MFIARQPIFTKNVKIYAYELLFRNSSKASSFGNALPNQATAGVVGGLFEQGIENIVGDAKAFVNFEYDFLMSDAIELINPEYLVIEVLETVETDQALVERLQYLKSKGYIIALDDFENSVVDYPLAPMVDVIKYDIMVTPLDQIRNEVKDALDRGKTILAEKIETQVEFEQAIKMGFHLFQGYFFSKPKIVGEANERSTSKAQYARILKELKKEEPSYNELTSLIESDVSLAYRVLKVSSHKAENMYDSIKKALLKMGLKEMERWICVLMLQEMSKGKPTELLKLSLVRSKFGEYIAIHCQYKKRKAEIMMMCLLSLIDVILDLPMGEALSGVMISEDVYNSLVRKKGELRPIIEFLNVYEQGNMERIDELSNTIGIKVEDLSKGYMQALEWTDQIFDMLI